MPAALELIQGQSFVENPGFTSTNVVFSRSERRRRVLRPYQLLKPIHSHPYADFLLAREEIIKPGKLGKITLARTWWQGNGATPSKGFGRSQAEAIQSRLGVVSRAGKLARLRSAAVL